MSRRRSVTHSRGRAHRGLSYGGAALVFVVLCGLLGALANTVPLPAGVVGFMALVIAILCWVAAGSHH